MKVNAADELIQFERQMALLANHHIATRLSGLIAPEKIKSQIVEQLATQAVQRSREILGPTLMWIREKNMQSTEALRAFGDQGLPRLLEHWEDFIHARCRAIDLQLKDIIPILGDSIVELKVLDGDPHNGAFQPLKISVIEDTKLHDFLYKSVDATPTEIAHHTANTVCNALGIATLVDNISKITENSYLREFSSVSKPVSTSEIERYYYAFGVGVSIASALEISDLHFENIITTKEGPKFIDIEFILSNSQYQNTKWSYKNSGLFEPGTSPIGQNAFHQHISPTYRIASEKIYYSHLDGKVCHHHILSDESGAPIDVTRFIHLISKGARDADAALRNKICDVHAALKDTASRNHTVRCWMRGTAYYRVLQIQLWLPTRSVSSNLDLIRGKLNNRATIGRGISTSAVARIIEAELHDLVRGDIPYFWIDGVSGDLMHATGMIQREFGLSTVNALAQRFRHLRTRSFSRNMEMIVRRMLSSRMRQASRFSGE